VDFALCQATEILERTPGALKALLSGLSDPWLEANEGAGTYSPRDVVGHLIFGEETDWIPRIRIILEHGALPFTPFDRSGFRERLVGRSTPDLLREFEEKRRANLATLRGLALQERQLELSGTHPELGRVTLGQLIAAWAVHDLGHLGQVSRVLARCYTQAVGPWRAHLTILDRR
jgi:hypothetical protein